MSKIFLSNNFIKKTCKLALNEDLYPSGDITSRLIKNNIKKKAKIISNQNGIIGGLKFAKETFNLIATKIRTSQETLCNNQLSKSLFSELNRESDVLFLLYLITKPNRKRSNINARSIKLTGFVCCNDLSQLDRDEILVEDNSPSFYHHSIQF